MSGPVTGDLGVFLPNGMDAETHETNVPGERLVWVREPRRALKAGMLVEDPEQVQGAIFALVEDLSQTHAQDLPDKMSDKSRPERAS